MVTKVEELIDLIKTSHPEWKNLSRYKLSTISGYSESTCYRALQAFNERKKRTKKSRSSSKNSNTNHQKEGRVNPPPLDIIDDPDELLYSVAIRELNKQDPDPRWASILIQCRKQIGMHKNEVMDSLQKQSTKALIEILKNLSGES